MTSKNSPVIKPQQALEDYLSALLSPGEEEMPEPEVMEVVARPYAQPTETAPVLLDDQQKEELQRTLLTPLQRQVASAPVEAVAEKAAVPESPVSVVSQPVEVSEPAPVAVKNTAPDDWLENGRPAWAQERFECLLFTVAGLKLAVPLVCLGGIHAVHDREEIRPLPGMPEWFLGLMKTGQGNLRVVDTARWVMPERSIGDSAGQMHYVIRMNGCDWGLSCDAVDKSFSVDPEQVRWRTARSKRPWLAGTLIDQMCALMDIEAFKRLLHESERRNRRAKN